MNLYRTAISRVATHKRRLQDGGVTVTTVKEYLTVQKSNYSKNSSSSKRRWNVKNRR